MTSLHKMDSDFLNFLFRAVYIVYCIAINGDFKHRCIFLRNSSCCCSTVRINPPPRIIHSVTERQSEKNCLQPRVFWLSKMIRSLISIRFTIFHFEVRTEFGGVRDTECFDSSKGCELARLLYFIYHIYGGNASPAISMLALIWSQTLLVYWKRWACFGTQKNKEILSV